MKIGKHYVRRTSVSYCKCICQLCKRDYNKNYPRTDIKIREKICMICLMTAQTEQSSIKQSEVRVNLLEYIENKILMDKITDL